MCDFFELTRQGYYAWRRRQAGGPGARERSDAELLEAIVAVFTATRGRYGAPRVHAELARQGWRVGHNRVARLMADNGLAGRDGRPPSVRTTVADPAATPSANVLNRDFSPAAPNQAWVTDITYLRSGEGFLFLAAIIDCYSRMVVGWAVADHLRTELCLAALDDAVARRQPEPGLIHHSDQGCQYTSFDYRRRLADLGMTQSMSRVGNCWDNAVAESFFSTLKLELIYTRREWETHADLKAALFEYIEVFYNRQRLHSTLDYCTPFEYDSLYANTLKAA